MDSKIVEFKAQRQLFKSPVSMPIDAVRAKLEITDDRKIKGYAIVWGSKNDYGEITLKGATLNSLNARGVDSTAGNPILILNQHRQSEPLCRPTILQEDDYGLYFEGEILTGTQYGDEFLEQHRQGVVKQMSYGFNYVWDKTEYDATLDAYILKEVKLGELSPVTYSSDASAQLRSFNQLQSESLLSKYSEEQISDLQSLLATRTATSIQEPPTGEKSKSNVTLF